ncbi:MAG: NAD-dependent epimerase/dehydratase family protein [Geminicoccaceae bacterium]
MSPSTNGSADQAASASSSVHAGEPVLVTGATGCTGGRLTEMLSERGAQTKILVRSAEKAARFKDPANVTIVEGDLVNAQDVMKAAEGVKRIYHIAALYRTANHTDQEYHDVNVGGAQHVLDAARHHGVERVVHCSTIGVHGDVKEIPCHEDSPFNPGDIYQVTKLEGEKLAQAAFAKDLTGAVVRPAGIYGPGDTRFLKLFKAIHKGVFFMVGSGKTLWHPVYIDDLCEGILLAGTHENAPGRTYVLASAHYNTLNEVAAEVANAVGKPTPKRRLPLWPFVYGAKLCETVCAPLGIAPPLHERRVAFFTKNRAFSIERARAELGYDPQFDIHEGFRRTADWYFAQRLLQR